jgi:thiol:disulfide interchange protein DsbA
MIGSGMRRLSRRPPEHLPQETALFEYGNPGKPPMHLEARDSRRPAARGDARAASLARRRALWLLALAAAGLRWPQTAIAQCRVTSIDPKLARQPGNPLPYRDLRPDPPGSPADAGCTPSPARVRPVLIEEFFSYGCDACSTLDTGLADLQRRLPGGTRLARVPTTDSALARLHARAFFAAVRLRKIDQLQAALYEAARAGGRNGGSIEELAAVFASAGIERDAFANELGSLEVYLELDRAASTSRRYGITAAPAVVVGGRYLTTPAIAGSSEEMIAAVEDRAAALRSPR